MNLFNRNKSSIPLLEEASTRFPEEKGNTPFGEILSFLFKRSAKHLKTHLERNHGLTLSHGQALNALSSSLGFSDWNTANATLQRITDEQAKNTSTAALPPVKVSTTPKLLADVLNFSTSSLVVGPAGCGKTCGLIFAAQRSRILDKQRPILVLRGFESPRYQPNWNAFLSVGDNASTLESLDHAVAPKSDDKLDVCPPDGDKAVWRVKALTAMKIWLEKRKHMNPLVIVEEAESLLGTHAEEFLRSIPEQATVVWTTQIIEVFRDFEVISSRFREIHLMRDLRYRYEMALPDQLKSSGAEQLLEKASYLSTGQVVTLTLPPTPSNKM